MTVERLTGEHKGRYGIRTPEGFMPAYEMAAGGKAAETIAAFQAGIDRLAAYEDLGVTPEQIREMDALYSELAKEVAAAREKQRAKPPHIYGDGYADGVLVYDMYDCPGCGEAYEIDYQKYDYCPKCGQAIDWSGYSEDGRDDG